VNRNAAQILRGVFHCLAQIATDAKGFTLS